MSQRQTGLHLDHQHGDNPPDHPTHDHHGQHQPGRNHRPSGDRGQNKVHGEEHQHGPQGHNQRSTPGKNISDRVFRGDQRQRCHWVEQRLCVVVQILAVQRHLSRARSRPPLRVQKQGAANISHWLTMAVILAWGVEMSTRKRLLAVEPTAIVPIGRQLAHGVNALLLVGARALISEPPAKSRGIHHPKQARARPVVQLRRGAGAGGVRHRVKSVSNCSVVIHRRSDLRTVVPHNCRPSDDLSLQVRGDTAVAILKHACGACGLVRSQLGQQNHGSG
mmetsp:Transcript_14493/g.31417  ORF Transcript_14493/g.31417 Transcript_14493/m.31417 type:complete len:277 (+) Transcript_14493:1233-2063(+)